MNSGLSIASRPTFYATSPAGAAVVLCLALLVTGIVSPANGQHAAEPELDPSLPPPRTLTTEQWRSDVHSLAQAIRERHPQPFHSVSEATFTAATERLLEALPNLEYEQIVTELARLVTLLGEGDGHSRLRLTPRFIGAQYPVRFWWFADGLYVRSAAQHVAGMAGKRVLALGGVAVEEALARLGEVVPGDNEFNRKLRMASHLVMPELLRGLGLADAEGLALELEAAGGSRESVRLEPVPWPGGFEHSIGSLAFEPLRLGAPEDWADMRPAAIAAPWPLRRLEEWYWMEPLDEGRALFVQLNAIGNQDDRESMAEFFENVFERCESEAVDKLILDVRYNGGGNNFFNRAVVHGLIRSDRMNVRGRTYVLIGRTTFSAAGNLVTKLANETNAVFVGEPSGSRPNHWGDARRVTLPESRLDVSISTLYWQDGGPFDEGPWLAPDVAVDQLSTHWASGSDPVLDATLALEPSQIARPFEEVLTAAFESAGFEAAIDAYEEYKADPAHRYVDTERPMNQAGYFLLGNDMVSEAIEVFRLNAGAYPESWNVHDSLGEALAVAGRVNEAIASYERSVAINPENQAGINALSRLRSRPSPGRAESMMAAAGISGLAVAVIEHGEIVRDESTGTADAASGAPITDETLFEAASLTKPLFATVALRLAERGELDLDQPLHELLPYERISHDVRARALTARLVLSHRTGLPNWGPETLEFGFSPGERFGYSGEAYMYLQRVLEHTTGLSLDELARREIFEPAGMEHSRLSWAEGEELVLAVPHDLAGKPGDKRPAREAMAAASLHTTARDYAKFVTAWMNGTLLRNETAALALEPAARVDPQDDHSEHRRAAAQRIAWGLGWGLQLPAASTEGPIAFHWGDNGDFKAFVAFDSMDESGIVYFSNSFNGLAIGDALASPVVGDMTATFDWLGYARYDDPGERDRLAGAVAVGEGRWANAIELFEAALAAGSEDETLERRIDWLGDTIALRDEPVTVPAELLRGYVGTYGPRSLTLKDGELWYQREGRSAYRLIPLSNTLFALDGELEFRVEIGLGVDATPEKLVGHYVQGGTDESPRGGD
jgi:CubicO group peptidase (beta-lactamase class C family)